MQQVQISKTGLATHRPILREKKHHVDGVIIDFF